MAGSSGYTMHTFDLLSIYDHIARLAPRRIALITQRYDYRTKYEDGAETREYSLRNRESAFTVQIEKMGIGYEIFRAGEARKRIKEIRKKGLFDMIIISGEVCSQSVSIAAELKKSLVIKPTFIEITEDEATSATSMRAVLTNAKNRQVTEILGHLVYLTRERKTPRTVQLEVVINEAPITPIKSVKKARPFLPTALDNASPPKRFKAQIARVIRDTEASNSLKLHYDYRCQICGIRIQLPDSRFYIEVHHIRPLGGKHGGTDTSDNMLVLCPNHHAMFDYLLPAFETTDAVQIEGMVQVLTKKHKIAQSVVDYHNKIRTERLS